MFINLDTFDAEKLMDTAFKALHKPDLKYSSLLSL